jgi:superfamily II DNA/RNA helicase
VVATDIAARGIHVDGIDIQLEMSFLAWRLT